MPAEVSGDARKAAISNMLEKKTATVKAHLRVVTNTMYAFVKWDDEYVKTKEEEEAWQAVSVNRADMRSGEQGSAHCLLLV